MLTSPVDINKEFASYYQNLYRSRVDYDPAELTAYLNNIDIPTLTLCMLTN